MTNKRMPKVEVLDTWYDDHQLCASLSVDGKEVSLWWSSWKTLAALTYYGESEKAREEVGGLVELILKADPSTFEDTEEDCDNRQTEWGFVDLPYKQKGE